MNAPINLETNSVHHRAKQKFPLPRMEDFACDISESQVNKLTERQFAVLAWIALGKPNLVIAKIIGISRKTVEKDCTLIFERLNAEDRYEAAAEFIRYVCKQQSK